MKGVQAAMRSSSGLCLAVDASALDLQQLPAVQLQIRDFASLVVHLWHRTLIFKP